MKPTKATETLSLVLDLLSSNQLFAEVKAANPPERARKNVENGVYNFVREDADTVTGAAIPRRYFSGGFMNKVAPLLIAGGIFIGSLASLPPDVRADAKAEGSARNVVVVQSGVSVAPSDIPEGLKVRNGHSKMPLGDQLGLWAGAGVGIGGLIVSGYSVLRWNKKRKLQKAEEKNRLEIEKLLSDLRVIKEMDAKGKQHAVEVLSSYWQALQRKVNEQPLEEGNRIDHKKRFTLLFNSKPSIKDLPFVLQREGWRPADLDDAFVFYLFANFAVSAASQKFLADNQDTFFRFIEENKNIFLNLGNLANTNGDNVVFAKHFQELVMTMYNTKLLSKTNSEFVLNVYPAFLKQVMSVVNPGNTKEISVPNNKESLMLIELYNDIALSDGIRLKKKTYDFWSLRPGTRIYRLIQMPIRYNFDS